MEEWLLQTLQKFDPINLIVIGFMIWIFYNKLDKKISKIAEEIKDIDRRLCRLEGAFSSKECCMLQDEKQLKKAE